MFKLKYLLFMLYAYLIINNNVYSNEYNTINLTDNFSELVLAKHGFQYNQSLVLRYILKSDSNVTKVMDGGSKIWASNSDTNVLRVLKIVKWYKVPKYCLIITRFNGSNQNYYYEKKGYEWFPTRKEKYENMLHLLEKNHRFDLSEEIDESSFSVDNINLGGLPANTVTPLGHVIIVQITDDYQILWDQDDESEFCSCVIIHGHPGNIKLVHLHIVSGRNLNQMFFAKNDEGWKQVDKREFYDILSILDSEENFN